MTWGNKSLGCFEWAFGLETQTPLSTQIQPAHESQVTEKDLIVTSLQFFSRTLIGRSIKLHANIVRSGDGAHLWSRDQRLDGIAGHAPGAYRLQAHCGQGLGVCECVPLSCRRMVREA